jgi:N-formylglutamate amidohydrolase
MSGAGVGGAGNGPDAGAGSGPDTGLGWIPSGTRFAPSDMLFYRDKGRRELDDVLPEVDVLVAGPHASAAFPEELAPFLADGLTRRLQYDYSDCTTSPITRRWAELDPHVLFVEDPHPRALRDPNRAPPEDLGAVLRDAFARVRAAAGALPSLTGVDAVRPVNFAGIPVFSEPTDEAGWQRLVGTLHEVAERGVGAYESLRDELVERVIDAKLRRLASLDPARLTVDEWRTATTLTVLSMHDTMNTTARPDGAISGERKPEDRLPDVVALSNRGDASGEVRVPADGTRPSADDVPTMDPSWIRALAEAHRRAFEVADRDQVALNRPYLGSREIQLNGPRLAALARTAVARHPDGPRIELRLGAVQAEFRREALLGEETTAVLHQPGTDWPEVPAAHVDDVAGRIKAAYDLFRRWGRRLDP